MPRTRAPGTPDPGARASGTRGVGTRVLGNGRYAAVVTPHGTGFSTAKGLLLTAWEPDPTERRHGVFLLVRDVARGPAFAATAAPLGEGRGGVALPAPPGCAAFAAVCDGVAQRLDVAVDARRDAELRRLALRNEGRTPRRLDVTAFVEVVLHPRLAHEAHPAFAKLFLATAWDAAQEVLLAHRRPRAGGDLEPWLAAALSGPGALSFETDRARFLGRGRDVARAAALEPGVRLAGGVGNVLDPVLALRREVELAPGAEVVLALALATAETRDEARDAAAGIVAPAAGEAVFAGAEAAERARQEALGLAPDEALAVQALYGAMLLAHPALRADAEVLARARGPLRRLARHGVRRDVPYVLVPPDTATAAARVAELLRARDYLAGVGVPLDLVILAADPARLPEAARSAAGASEGQGAAGGVRCWPLAEVATDEADLLAAAAACVADAPLAALAERVEGTGTPSAPTRAAPRWRPADAAPAAPGPADAAAPPAPEGGDPRLPATRFGHFAPGAREFVIPMPAAPVATRRSGLDPSDGDRPPLPWVNVVANERAGFLVSESGSANTWVRNSRENKLTPWSNDAVTDPFGEALYLRDEEAEVVWSPQPGPVPGPAPYEVRHGRGYTMWRHESIGLIQEVTAFVPIEDPLKVVRVVLEDRSGRDRVLSAFAFQRLLLGALVSESARLVTTRLDPLENLLLARGIGDERHGEVAFAAAVAPPGATIAASGDRAAFLGAGGRPERPRAVLHDALLDGRVGAALDACFAVQVRLAVPAGGRVAVSFLLGEGASDEEARALVARYRRPGAVDAALGASRRAWEELEETLRVATPSAALDAMAGGWLLYQTVSCRLWARSAFYQSGGAFGFRDQLQDAAALLLVRPDLTRGQILRHAAHQFPEGDVLHWWHPPSGRGTRTRFSDDLLWLPWVTADYVRATGDAALLDAAVPFVRARALRPGEDEALLDAEPTAETASVFDHCLRAIDRSLGRGAHGLPLMGSGDWNDGMNRVGREGRGESVWLGFFLYEVLGAFAPLCEARGEGVRAARYRAHRDALAQALEAAWDGGWYRRAYDDAGLPWGSATSEECRIDLLPQAWAVTTGAVSAERAARALDAAEHHLVSERDGLVRLLTPPFDVTPRDPGYIKGYLPGIRENGGQYTHAALWLVRALARAGRRERAAALLEMLTPVAHAASDAAVSRYRVEPYVVAADVYGAPPHVGRGGWTWYTGSSGWFWRVLVEEILGIRVEGGALLRVRPCIPDAWPGFRVAWRVPGPTGGAARYEVVVRNPEGCSEAVVSAHLDGRAVPVDEAGAALPLVRDGATHQAVVALGRRGR